jgi:hypothetical protein
MKLSFEGPEMSTIVRNESHFETRPKAAATIVAGNDLAANSLRQTVRPKDFRR